VAKLPYPKRPLPRLGRGHLRQLALGSVWHRAYRRGGTYPGAWNTVRYYGPTQARFDPHVPPPRDQDRGILYAAASIPTALVEAFGNRRVIERSFANPWIASFELATPILVLDLTGAWPTFAGSSQAISSGRKDIARLWAQAIYEDYPEVEGLLYPSSMSGTRRQPGDPPMHGLALALFDRGARGLPGHPSLHLPLLHPGLDAALGEVADRYKYSLIP